MKALGRGIIIILACLPIMGQGVFREPAPSLNFSFKTPQYVNPQPISDATINAARSAVSARATAALTTIAASPFPSPTCTGSPPDSCWLGKLNAALVLYTLNRNQTDITNASAYLQSALDGLPTAGGYLGISAAQGWADTFHFGAAQSLYQIMYQFGPSGTVTPGLVTTAQYNQGVTIFFNWASASCRLADINQNSVPLTSPFEVWLTENNDITKDTACLAADTLAAASSYATTLYADGTTATQQLPLQLARAKSELRRIGLYGGFIEYYSTYSQDTMQGIVFYRDLVNDTTINTLANNVLDMWWCGWALEQANGNYGGPATRMYFSSAIGNQPMAGFAWLYFNFGNQLPIEYPALMSIITSYRPPMIAYALALDTATKGSYEVFGRSLGSISSDAVVVDQTYNYWFQANVNPATLISPTRYTYVGVDANNVASYAIGSTISPRLAQAVPHGSNSTGYMAISDQNKRYGVSFGAATDFNKKVVIQTDASSGISCNSCTVGAQSKSLLIAQELSNTSYAYRAGNIHAYFESTMTRNESGGWIFCDCGTGWAAVRPAWGTYSWDTTVGDHQSISLNDNTAPIILQVATKTDYTSLSDFQAAVLSGVTFVQDTTAKTLTVTGLLGSGTIVYDYLNGGIPTVNGSPIDTSNTWAWKSPFMNSVYGSGIVNIAISGRSLTLNFN